MRDKFNSAKNPNCDGYQRGRALMIYKFFDKEISATSANKFAGSGIKNGNISNKELAEELLEELWKAIFRKFKIKKVLSTFIADFTDMQLITKLSQGFRCLLFVIDIFNKYAWVIPLKDKKRCYNY